MGLSHLAIVRAHPDVELVAACDSSGYLTDVLSKHANLKCHSDFDRMLAEEQLGAVVIATPSKLHASMVQKALERGLHVFCEKPFVLNLTDGTRLCALAENKGLVTQVGYVFRFVGTFQEAARVAKSGALGAIHHVRSEAYGPVVLRPKGSTWRSSKNEGGGALYDYACHAVDLVNFIAGVPDSVSGVVRHSVFSNDVEDEVYCSLHYANGASGQLCVNCERREFPEDVHQGIGMGHQWPHHRGSAGMPDLSARSPREPSRHWSGLDCALYDGRHRRGMVLPARRGIFGPDRLLRSKHQEPALER